MTAHAMKPIPLFKAFIPDTALEALQPVLESGQLASGDKIRQFEQMLGDYVGNPRLTGMSDVSGALTLALFMAGVRPGDEVITSPLACTATTMPIANLFARPVWCDVDPQTGMPDGNRITALITPRTRAVLLYHWSGDVGDIDGINAVARRHGIKTLDDASEAFGAEYKGRRLGNNGSDFTVYSFHAVKHITTGEGAALFVSSKEDSERAKWLKRYGIHQPSFRLPNGDLNPDSDIPVAGFNFYLNNIAAALGVEQFKHVEGIVGKHRENGQFYDEALNSMLGLKLLRRRQDSVSGYWTYSLLAERRNDLMRKLHQLSIGAQRLHLRNDHYACFGESRASIDLPGVDAFDRENLSIPCGWWVTREDRERIADCIRAGW